jgi:solute carrier family 6 (neurotransmitter transporter, GABA) member 1
MNFLRKGVDFFAPPAQKSADGRDQWGTRAGFVLAAMGGAVGLGNLLRYPSQVFNNHGAQWFIPYVIALIFLGIPVLLLELSLGQAYRGGCVIAWDHVSKRLKGVGLSVVFNGYSVVIYYIPLIAFIMKYFRHSFRSPLPWTGDTEGAFWYGTILDVVDPVENGAYLSYPGTAINGETAGWCLFVYFIVWLCICRGVGVTGRVVYFTMGIPIITIIILVGRSASLPNAGDGIKLNWAQWHSSKLGGAQIWQSALGQIFFSIGVGFGYFTCWASYQNPHANTVQDALIIAFSNSAIEVIGAFAVFGVVGFLQMFPGEVDPLGTFSVGFLTYPQAIVEMPGANFWAILFFFTLFLLGLSSAFALLDVMVTTLHDTELGKKYPRWVISTSVTIVSYLISLPFCTQFGLYFLDAVDTWVNYLALFFVVWCECQGATMVYRFRDVTGQVGVPAFAAYNCGLVGGQILGVGIGHAVSPAAGAGVGFGVFVAGLGSSLFLAKTPDIAPPKMFANNVLLSKLWYMAFYSVSLPLLFDIVYLNVSYRASNFARTSM